MYKKGEEEKEARKFFLLDGDVRLSGSEAVEEERTVHLLIEYSAVERREEYG